MGFFLGVTRTDGIRDENIRGTRGKFDVEELKAREGQIEMVWTCPEK